MRLCIGDDAARVVIRPTGGRWRFLLSPSSGGVGEVRKKKTAHGQSSVWYLLELNQGHMDFQSIALPPELRYLVPSIPIPSGGLLAESGCKSTAYF